MLTGGRRGVALAGGFFLGAILSPFAIYKLYVEPAESKIHAQDEAVHANLSRQNVQLFELLKQELIQNRETTERDTGSVDPLKVPEKQASTTSKDIDENKTTTPDQKQFSSDASDQKSCDE